MGQDRAAAAPRTQARFPYQDPTLAVDQRVEDLLSRMELADKTGALFQPFAPLGDVDAPGMFGSPSTREILDLRINHVSILQARSARELAEWHNMLQTEALRSPLGIPFTLATDPRHAFANNPGTAMTAGPFSQWPEPLGFGAIGDADLVGRYGDTVRREYLAVGLRTALHPQIDLASDPRWARANGTFGSDADLTGRLAVAYVHGLQGEQFGRESVSAMVKHFPGGGPQQDGEDPHMPYGREQVYPGERFDLHLQPFREVIAAGARQMMPYYGMPVGLVLDGEPVEAVGFSFNKRLVAGLLREELGYQGIICTDWGVLSGMCWGVEDLSFEERMLKAFDAGVDQFGGEWRPDVLAGLVTSGQVTQERLDASVRRVLTEKFELGLFDRPFVDVERADDLVGAPSARAEGLAAQMAAHTLLSNGTGVARLPLARTLMVYVEGVDASALAGWAEQVHTPAEADVAVVRTVAPWEQRGKPGELEFFFHAGSLDFHDAELQHLREIAAQAPLVVDVYLDRPAILGPVRDIAASLLVNFGSTDAAFLQVLFGAAKPEGRLPFEIPASMEAVWPNLADVPNDTIAPSFSVGHGLRYEGWVPAPVPTDTEVVEGRSRIVEPEGIDLAVTTLAQLLTDERARAVIDEHVPGLSDNPMIDMIKDMPFALVLQLAAGDLPPEVTARLTEQLELL